MINFRLCIGPDTDPVQLAANAGKGFVGSYVLGMGFTFDVKRRNPIASAGPMTSETKCSPGCPP